MNDKAKEIIEANAEIQTVGIDKRNKDGTTSTKAYAEVNQRIKAFRMVFPQGSIDTSIIKDDGNHVLMKTTVCDEEGRLLGTGYAHEEKKPNNYVNATSLYENCETSSVGRALGICGFGIETSLCSVEELKEAIRKQEEIKANEAKGKTNKRPVKAETPIDISFVPEALQKWILEKVGKKDVKELNNAERKRLIEIYQQNEEKKKGEQQ